MSHSPSTFYVPAKVRSQEVSRIPTTCKAAGQSIRPESEDAPRIAEVSMVKFLDKFDTLIPLLGWDMNISDGELR
jgi:hypothetical protein